MTSDKAAVKPVDGPMDSNHRDNEADVARQHEPAQAMAHSGSAAGVSSHPANSCRRASKEERQGQLDFLASFSGISTAMDHFLAGVDFQKSDHAAALQAARDEVERLSQEIEPVRPVAQRFRYTGTARWSYTENVIPDVVTRHNGFSNENLYGAADVQRLQAHVAALSHELRQARGWNGDPKVSAETALSNAHNTATAYRERAEAAERRVTELERALQPFSDFANRFGDYGRDDTWQLTRNPSGTGNLTMGDVRAARAALAPAKKVD